ncbi:MAG TPA: lysylphosphatidylglycerol synthase transmembrane domain-containing protein, partial [Candidatus Woesebacteria bacterium]|nr:lysylphosphatidylglycerol synthase transmembrane domain-containing protein [Candidatus Woesebacteria bacterium]
MNGKMKKVWWKILLSFFLIYLVWIRVDFRAVGKELAQAPWWLAIALVAYLFLTNFLAGRRWSLVLLGNEAKWADTWNFVKSNYIGSFYGLVFPTAVAGDLLKWLPLISKYKKISKAKIGLSVLTDRIIGGMGFLIVAFLVAVAGYFFKIPFPIYLLWLFSFGLGAMIIFLIIINFIHFEKYLWGRKLTSLIECLRKENHRVIIRGLILSIVGQILWAVPTWVCLRVFGTTISFWSAMIILPIISAVLVLPISVAGFGAREQLFLFFFTQMGGQPEKVVAASAFIGIIGVLNSLIGGLLMLK